MILLGDRIETNLNGKQIIPLFAVVAFFKRVCLAFVDLIPKLLDWLCKVQAAPLFLRFDQCLLSNNHVKLGSFIKYEVHLLNHILYHAAPIFIPLIRLGRFEPGHHELAIR